MNSKITKIVLLVVWILSVMGGIWMLYRAGSYVAVCGKYIIDQNTHLYYGNVMGRVVLIIALLSIDLLLILFGKFLYDLLIRTLNTLTKIYETERKMEVEPIKKEIEAIKKEVESIKNKETQNEQG